MVSAVAVLMVLDIDFPDSMVVAVNAELVISYCGLPSKRGTQKWTSTYLRQKGLGLVSVA